MALALLALFSPAGTSPAQSTMKTDTGAMTPTVCPWLTEGTAADVLGGEVAMTVTGGSQEGTCFFSRNGAAMDSLRIRVSTAPLAVCRPGSTPLRGIGNEAERCPVQESHGVVEEMASGRVRAWHFTVILSSRSQRRRASPSDDDALVRIAEEVAGNLY